jgi:non-specific serine/threonine protein kinase
MDETGRPAFAQFLRSLRLDARLSQEELAEKAGMSVEAISALERGVRRTPHRETVALLARALALDDRTRAAFEAAARSAPLRGQPHSPASGSLPSNKSGNLTAQLSTLVGRDDALAAIGDLLTTYRLVTLVGIGGIGKTRCALEIGANMGDASADGAWFVDLAPLGAASLVDRTIATTLGLQEATDRTVPETIVAYLEDKRDILILDNCEHVLLEAAAIAETLLGRCPQLRILATSRERLKVPGEAIYRMPSLSIPPAGTVGSAAEVARSGAAMLFVDRARAIDSRFELTNQNASAVRDICRRLDGLPLAIELAAARLAVLSPAELSRGLSERFDILTGGHRNSPRRQTMRAVFDWSYDLLSEQEQIFLCRLSPIAGSFTLQTAGGVAVAEPIASSEVLDLMCAVVEKSLVFQDAPRHPDSERRFRVPESLRDYLLEKLERRGERDATMRRYARWATEFLNDAATAWATTPSRVWSAHVEPELENIRAAFLWALGNDGDVTLGVQLAIASRRFWGAVSPVEGQRWIRKAIDRLDDTSDPSSTGGLWLAHAHLCTALWQYAAALESSQRALEALRTPSDEVSREEARGFAGLALAFLGKAQEGMPLLLEALERYRVLNLTHLVGHALNDLALAHAIGGDILAARGYFREALSIFRGLGNDRGTTSVSANLAEIELWSGNLEEAVRLGSEAVSGAVNTRAFERYLSNLAAYYVAMDRWDDASACSREVLDRRSVGRDDIDSLLAVQHLAAVAALRSSFERCDDRSRAAQLLGFVDAKLAEIRSERQWTERQEYDRTVRALHAELGPDEYALLANEGRLWSDQRAISEALLIAAGQGVAPLRNGG